MASIKFIRVYDFYGTSITDILYESNRLRTVPTQEMPNTAREWLKGRTGIKQYDKVLKRESVIYK